MMQVATQFLQTDRIMVGIFMIGLLGFAMDRLEPALDLAASGRVNSSTEALCVGRRSVLSVRGISAASAPGLWR